MKSTQVKQHARSVKGKGNTTVRKHYRKGGAKTKDLTSSMAAKHGSLMDMIGADAKCKTCGKKGCSCKKDKGITVKTKYSKTKEMPESNNRFTRMFSSMQSTPKAVTKKEMTNWSKIKKNSSKKAGKNKAY